MQIAVVGAGWFGCHIAAELLKKNIQVTVFEKNGHIFSEASHYNTGRLHQGFHYPRSAKTRQQCRQGFQFFTTTYPHLSHAVANNLYLLSAHQSLMDFETYCAILTHEGYVYQPAHASAMGFRHTEGALLCTERAIDHSAAAAHFTQLLQPHLRLGTEVTAIVPMADKVLVHNEPFDYCINCTYYALHPLPPHTAVEYETVVTLLMQPTPLFTEKSFVMMDGDFFSLNPYYSHRPAERSLYHVKHSVVHRSTNIAIAQQQLYTIRQRPWQEQLPLQALLADVALYYPVLLQELTPTGTFVSLRTKPVNNNASRECIIEAQNRHIHVLSGKVNSIFEASEQVLRCIGLSA